MKKKLHVWTLASCSNSLIESLVIPDYRIQAVFYPPSILQQFLAADFGALHSYWLHSHLKHACFSVWIRNDSYEMMLSYTLPLFKSGNKFLVNQINEKEKLLIHEIPM